MSLPGVDTDNAAAEWEVTHNQLTADCIRLQELVDRRSGAWEEAQRLATDLELDVHHSMKKLRSRALWRCGCLLSDVRATSATRCLWRWRTRCRKEQLRVCAAELEEQQVVLEDQRDATEREATQHNFLKHTLSI